MKRKICIVGGVAGGATTAAKLRRLNELDEIIMFEKDEYISFANCGLPYYVSKTISDRSKLIVQTIEDMEARFNIDIRNFSEVISINRETKEITVKNIKENKEYKESYDVLILSPGATPIVPPIAGLNEANNVFILRNIPHVDAIDDYINQHQPNHVTVIGGGFIGVEMAENLVERGLQVTVVDMANQVLAPVDFEMAQIVHQELTRHGVKLVLNDGVKAFHNQGKTVETASGTKIDTDMIILAIGVSPETKLAREANLDIGELKAIKVNQFMQTNDPSIYALGDAVEVTSRVNKLPTKIPLAWPANRQAIVVANHINNVKDHYPGTLGTAVAKVFDLTVASTGFNEKLCKMYNMDYKVIHVNRNNHASYYPNAMPILLKVIFNTKDGQILGAQAVGHEGTEKRIDVLATAMIGKLKVTELPDLELSYAPPYGSAKDPVNIAGYVATHVYDQSIKTVQWHELDQLINEGATLLDVRTLLEQELHPINNSINIDVDELRSKLHEIPDKEAKIIITCQVGHRGYIATRILQENGYTNVLNLDGGYYLYEIANHDFTKESDNLPNFKVSDVDHQSSSTHDTENMDDVVVVDACGLQCPGPILATFKAMEKIKEGQKLKVEASDIGFYKDVSKWAEKTGNSVVDLQVIDKKVVAILQKGKAKISNEVSKTKENATIVLFSGEFDKAMAAMIIANGAAAMGKKVSIFFTFWGLNALRKSTKENVDKTSIEAMFGKMMPRGAQNLPLSNMNMAGMGKAMINKVMQQKNVESLPNLMQQALDMGVEFIACTMSMDIMGIKKEELIDQVSLAGVAAYLAESDDAGLTLFI